MSTPTPSLCPGNVIHAGRCCADLPLLPALVQPAQQLFQAKYKAEEHLGVLAGVPNAD